ncbi:MAG: type IV pilus modification PilV family protein [Armatimonadota bacterium]
MNRRRRSKSRGFTLVELLVSSVILAIGFIALSQLYLASMWTYWKAHYLSVATERAQQEIEYAQRLKFPALDTANANSLATYYLEPGYTALDTGRGVHFYERKLPSGEGTLTVTNYNTYSYLLKVTVEVNWLGPPQGQSKIKISTLISK